MTTRRLSLAALLALSACAPSIDPAAKADIDERAAALKPTGQSYSTPIGFEPMPIQIGQWASYKMVDDKGQPSFLTHKVVGEDSGAYWIETVTESYYGKHVIKMLVALGDRKRAETMEIRAFKSKDKNGKVTEMDPQTLGLMKGLWKDSLATLVIAWQGQPQEEASTPAGTFPSCYKVKTTAAWGPWKSASLSWNHPQVPLSGVVKSEGIDQPNKMELVSFGESGASTEIP